MNVPSFSYCHRFEWTGSKEEAVASVSELVMEIAA